MTNKRTVRSTLIAVGVAAFAEPDREIGTSTVKRHDDRIKMTMRASTQPKEAFTIWWVVFNDPAACNGSCDADDLIIDGDPDAGLNESQIEAADIAAAYATGDVSTPSWRANFKAELDVDEPAGTREIILGDGAALKEVNGADVHLVARSHGSAIPKRIDKQTGSFAGGCGVFLNPPSQPSAEGEYADVLFTVHTP